MHNEKHTHPSIVGKSAQIKNAKTKLVEGEPTVFGILNLASLYIPDQTIETEEIIKFESDEGTMLPHKTTVDAIGSIIVKNGLLFDIQILTRNEFFLPLGLHKEAHDLVSEDFTETWETDINPILIARPFGYGINLEEPDSIAIAVNNGYLFNPTDAIRDVYNVPNQFKIVDTLLSLPDEPHFVDRDFYRSYYKDHVNPN